MPKGDLAGKSADYVPGLAQGGKEHKHDQNVMKVEVVRGQRKK
jgi:hypothetical protein